MNPIPITLTIFGIPNCDTVKKARAWLSEHGVAHAFVDFKKQGVDDAALARWLAQLGWQALLNTRGTTWRRLDDAARAAVTDAASAQALMLAQPSVIKRPVVAWPDGSVSAGFEPSAWQARLDRGTAAGVA
jgi:Spx/MgsR family transcriptional regulator